MYVQQHCLSAVTAATLVSCHLRVEAYRGKLSCGLLLQLSQQDLEHIHVQAGARIGDVYALLIGRSAATAMSQVCMSYRLSALTYFTCIINHL